MERSENEQIIWEEAQATGIADLSDADLLEFGRAIAYEQAELEQLTGLLKDEVITRLYRG